MTAHQNLIYSFFDSKVTILFKSSKIKLLTNKNIQTHSKQKISDHNKILDVNSGINKLLTSQIRFSLNKYIEYTNTKTPNIKLISIIAFSFLYSFSIILILMILFSSSLIMHKLVSQKAKFLATVSKFVTWRIQT